MEVSSASPALAMAPAARRGETLPAVARPRVAVLRPGMGLALPSRLPFERWLNIGMQLSAASTSVAWCLGDWLAFGERAFAGHYRQAVEATCLDYQTLRNYARVARRFGMFFTRCSRPPTALARPIWGPLSGSLRQAHRPVPERGARARPITESDVGLAAMRLPAESVLIGHGSQAWQFGAHISLIGVQTPA